MAKKDNTIWWVIGVIVVLVILVGGGIGIFSGKCTAENGNIIVGTLKSDGKCCNGLIAQSPEGFSGGAWCVKPYCQVSCLSGQDLLAEIQGITNVEGIYSLCHSQTDSTATLLKQTSCPRF